MACLVWAASERKRDWEGRLQAASLLKAVVEAVIHHPRCGDWTVSFPDIRGHRGSVVTAVTAVSSKDGAVMVNVGVSATLSEEWEKLRERNGALLVTSLPRVLVSEVLVFCLLADATVCPRARTAGLALAARLSDVIQSYVWDVASASKKRHVEDLRGPSGKKLRLDPEAKRGRQVPSNSRMRGFIADTLQYMLQMFERFNACHSLHVWGQGGFCQW